MSQEEKERMDQVSQEEKEVDKDSTPTYTQENVIQKLDIEGADVPSDQSGEDDDIDDEPYEEGNERLWNQNLRLISAIIVAIISAAFIWWFVS